MWKLYEVNPGAFSGFFTENQPQTAQQLGDLFYIEP